MSFKQQIKQVIERIKASDIATRLTSGAFWSIMGNVLGKGFVLLAFIVVARIIGKEQYGELGMIRSTIFMFSGLAGAGIGLTASRYIALYRNACSRRTREVYLLSHYSSIGIGLLISISLYFFAPLIARLSLEAPHLTTDLRLGALALFFVTLNMAQNGALLGFERFKSIAVNTVISGIVQLLFLWLGAYYWGMPGVIIGMGLNALVLWGLNQYALRTSLPRKQSNEKGVKQISRETCSILWKFSLPAVMSTIMMIPTLWWCKTLVVQTAGFASMANYDVAEQWNTIILFIPSTLSGIIVPILSNILAEGSTKQYKKVVRVNIAVNALITIFAALFIDLLAAFILKSYGVAFTDKNTFRILVLSTIPNAIAAVLGQVIASKGKMWAGFILNLVWSIWLILFSLLFVEHLGYGSLGLALAVLCAYILHVIFSYAYMWAKVINEKTLLMEETT